MEPNIVSPDSFKNVKSFDQLTIEDYKIALEDISKRSIKVPIQNNSPEHASILMKYIFDETNHEIGFYVNKFSGTFSSNSAYLESLSNCLNRNVRVYVLVDNEPNQYSLAYQMIFKHIRETGNGKIGKATKKSLEQISVLFENNKSLHFLVSDSKRYRIELNQTTRAAYAHFNDQYMGQILTEALSESLSFSEKIL
jgi:hypothetical protein